MSFPKSQPLISYYALNVECELICSFNDRLPNQLCVCVYACTHCIRHQAILNARSGLHHFIYTQKSSKHRTDCFVKLHKFFSFCHFLPALFPSIALRAEWMQTFDLTGDVCKMGAECHVDVMWLSLLTGRNWDKYVFELCSSAGNRIESP